MLIQGLALALRERDDLTLTVFGCEEEDVLPERGSERRAPRSASSRAARPPRNSKASRTPR